MSVRVMSRVWEHFEGSSGELLLILALADWSSDTGNKIYPSMKTLTAKVRLTDRQVRCVLRDLEGKGWIRTVRKSSGGARTNTRGYRIDLIKLTATPDAHITLSIINHQLTTSTFVESKLPTCPHQKIIETYHESLPMLPRMRIWNKTRGRLLQARWKEDPERQSIDWWQKFFGSMSKSNFLTGKTNGSGDREPFLANLEWLISLQNFAKVIERQYHRDQRQQATA